MSWSVATLELAATGGSLIGASVSLLYWLHGRIAGVSGIFGHALLLSPGAWRWGFLGGLLGVGVLARMLGVAASPALLQTGAPVLALAGLLVGFGTTLGNGCTSGHGICGLARFSSRSALAVGIFMAAAAATVFVVRRLGIAL